MAAVNASAAAEGVVAAGSAADMKSAGGVLCCFYWRFGQLSEGWWIGRRFGSQAGILAHCPGTEARRPPTSGWQVVQTETHRRRLDPTARFVEAKSAEFATPATPAEAAESAESAESAEAAESAESAESAEADPSGTPSEDPSDGSTLATRRAAAMSDPAGAGVTSRRATEGSHTALEGSRVRFVTAEESLRDLDLRAMMGRVQFHSEAQARCGRCDRRGRCGRCGRCGSRCGRCVR